MIEDLDAVVLVRIVGSRDHHPSHEGIRVREEGDAGSRDQAREARTDPRAGQPTGHVRRDPRPRFPGVHSKQDLRIAPHPGGQLAKRHTHGLRGLPIQWVLAGHPSDAVRAEQLLRHLEQAPNSGGKGLQEVTRLADDNDPQDDGKRQRQQLPAKVFQE